MRQANTTFVNLRAALDDLDPLIADTKVVMPELAPFLRRVRPVVSDSVPVFKSLGLALNTPGDANDLSDALALAPGTERQAARAVAPTVTALADSLDLIAFARPYAPDLLSVIGKLGASAGYYDFNGHYLRASAGRRQPLRLQRGNGRTRAGDAGESVRGFRATRLRPEGALPRRRDTAERRLAEPDRPPVPRRRPPGRRL